MKKLYLILACVLFLAHQACAQNFIYGMKGSASSGGGNATVPVDAPILPPQAFVDHIAHFYVDYAALYDFLEIPDAGLTHIKASLVQNWANHWLADPVGEVGSHCIIDLSGNALPVADVNEILNRLTNPDWASYPLDLDLSGGTNAAPTGQGLLDKATLIGLGCTVTTN